jgi:membrane protease YdiL (CAAX protease family)
MIDVEDKNPFLRLRSRTLIWWCLASLPVLGIVATGKRGEIVVSYGIYGVILLWAWWQFRRLGINTPRLIGTLSRDSVWIPMMAVIVPVVGMFSVGSWLVLLAFLSHTAPSVGTVLTQTASQTIASIPWGLGVLVAPPVEELLFRGILLHRWSAKWGLRKAVLLTSLAFAVLHVGAIGMFVFGYVMAVLYIRSRTLIVPIICHALNNALAFSLSGTRNTGTASLSILFPFAALCTVVTGACILYFVVRYWPGADCHAPYFPGDSRSLPDSTPVHRAADSPLEQRPGEAPDNHPAWEVDLPSVGLHGCP